MAAGIPYGAAILSLILIRLLVLECGITDPLPLREERVGDDEADAASGDGDNGPSGIAGMRAAVTQKGLDYLNLVGVPILQNELKMYEQEDINRSASFFGVKFHYSISNILVNELEFGKSSITVSPKIGLVLTLNKTSVSASADFAISPGSSYSLLRSFFNFINIDPLIDGSIAVRATDLQLRIGITLSADEEGHPHINTSSCRVEVGDLNITIDGPAKIILGHFLKGLNQTHELNKYACKELRNLLSSINKKLATIEFVLPLGSKDDSGDIISGIDLSLTKQPSFSTDAIITCHKGDIVSITQPNMDPPFPRITLPSTPPSSSPSPSSPSGKKMAYIEVTKYVVNTALLVYQRAGILQDNVTAESVDDDDKATFLRLDTTTFSLIVPQMFHRFGARDLMLTIRARKDLSSVSIDKDGVRLDARAAMDVYVVCNYTNTSPESPEKETLCNDTSMPLAITFGVSANVRTTFCIGDRNNTLYFMGNASDLKVNLSVIESNIGDVDVEKINKAAVGLRLIQTKALPRINKWANKGYSIPDIIEGLALKDPKLIFQKDHVILETDISYNNISTIPPPPSSSSPPDSCDFGDTDLM